jgi:hypothetical protein
VSCSSSVESEWRTLVSVGSTLAMDFNMCGGNPPRIFRDMQTQARFVIGGKVCFKSV